MRFVPTALEGAYVIELEPHEDARGTFARIWCRDELAAVGLDTELAQCSVSRNPFTETVRGLHFQRAPHQETKIVRCTAGAIFDVIVDLRPGFPTEAEWFGVRLDATAGAAMYVPKGFAHGFQTLVDATDVLYLISDPYVPGAAAGVRWDDPAFGIAWPEALERTFSERDCAWPDFTSGELELGSAEIADAF